MKKFSTDIIKDMKPNSEFMLAILTGGTVIYQNNSAFNITLLVRLPKGQHLPDTGCDTIDRGPDHTWEYLEFVQYPEDDRMYLGTYRNGHVREAKRNAAEKYWENYHIGRRSYERQTKKVQS